MQLRRLTESKAISETITKQADKYNEIDKLIIRVDRLAAEWDSLKDKKENREDLEGAERLLRQT